MCWSRDSAAAPSWTCGPMERGATLQQSVPEGLSLIERAYAEAFMKNCILWESLTLEKFMKDCLPQERPHAGAWKEREEEGAAETMRKELTETPARHAARPLSVRRQRNRVQS